MNSDDDEEFFFFKIDMDRNLDITSNDYIYLKSLRYLTLDEQKKIDYFENNINHYFVKLPEKTTTKYYENDI
jgi:hypothetical protein